MDQGRQGSVAATPSGASELSVTAMENQVVDNMRTFHRFLVPSDILSDLLIMFELDDDRCIIREKLLLIEETDRVEAVTRLMGEVLVHGERGFSLLLNALRGEEGDLPDWWNRALDSPESSQPHEMKEDQCSVLMDAFEGQVTRRISQGELKTILLHLVSRKVLNKTDVEQVRGKLSSQGQEKATQHMITCLRRRTQNWAWELFLVLVKIKPELVRKIDPCYEECSSGDGERNTTSAALNGAADQETPTHCLDRDIDSTASSSAADIRDDDSEGSFSDVENKDKDAEKESQKNSRPKGESCQPRDLCLRGYQQELSTFALQGLNTIICAPTGSGKTRIAVHIVGQHLSAATDGRQRKVAFMARTVPLATQQHKNFEKYLPNFKTICVTGESEYSMNLHNLLPEYDILVVTPKVLENHIKPDKIPSLAAFSLLIFDECHHTRKGEPYNSLMKSYLRSMKEKQPDLPQIVGLTASIGIEKATTVSEAVDSILTIMGNMDVQRLSTVKVHNKELEDTVPKPVEDHTQLVSREDDEISTKIKEIMKKVETMLKDCGSHLYEMEINNLLTKVPPNKASQQYGQWAVSLRNQVRLLKFAAADPNTSEGRKEDERKTFARDVQVLADTLVAYNEALEVHDLTRPQDVLQHLQRKIEQKMSKDNATSNEKEVLRLYKEGLKKTLLKSKETNPNLDTLGQTMTNHLEQHDEESRIIIFVRTRATCRAVCEWLNSHREHVLQTLRATPFTGTGAHQDRGGMTQVEQEAVIDKFRRGDVRVLVTTSVGEEGIDIPECNLVIKYNHVGNEVTTVQTRGRSRKQGGRSILMAQQKILMQEALNQRRAAMMYQAIQRVDAMTTEEVKQRVQQVQKKILENEEIRSIVRKSITENLLKEEFSLECCQCHKVSVDSSQLRTINDSHHVIIGKAFTQQVTILSKQSKRVNGMIISGEVVCKECENHLGHILNKDGMDFIIIGIKTWTLLDKDRKPSNYKRWKDVPYDVAELAPDDIKEHLASEGDLSQEPSQPLGAAGSCT